MVLRRWRIEHAGQRGGHKTGYTMDGNYQIGGQVRRKLDSAEGHYSDPGFGRIKKNLKRGNRLFGCSVRPGGGSAHYFAIAGPWSTTKRGMKLDWVPD